MILAYPRHNNYEYNFDEIRPVSNLDWSEESWGSREIEINDFSDEADFDDDRERYNDLRDREVFRELEDENEEKYRRRR